MSEVAAEQLRVYEDEVKPLLVHLYNVCAKHKINYFAQAALGNNSHASAFVDQWNCHISFLLFRIIQESIVKQGLFELHFMSEILAKFPALRLVAEKVILEMDTSGKRNN